MSAFFFSPRARDCNLGRRHAYVLALASALVTSSAAAEASPAAPTTAAPSEPSAAAAPPIPLPEPAPTRGAGPLEIRAPDGTPLPDATVVALQAPLSSRRESRAAARARARAARPPSHRDAARALVAPKGIGELEFVAGGGTFGAGDGGDGPGLAASALAPPDASRDVLIQSTIAALEVTRGVGDGFEVGLRLSTMRSGNGDPVLLSPLLRYGHRLASGTQVGSRLAVSADFDGTLGAAVELPVRWEHGSFDVDVLVGADARVDLGAERVHSGRRDARLGSLQGSASVTVALGYRLHRITVGGFVSGASRLAGQPIDLQPWDDDDAPLAAYHDELISWGGTVRGTLPWRHLPLVLGVRLGGDHALTRWGHSARLAVSLTYVFGRTAQDTPPP